VYDALNKMCSAAGDPLLVKEGLRELEKLLQGNSTDGEWRDVHRDKFLMELARAVSPSQVRKSAGKSIRQPALYYCLDQPLKFSSQVHKSSANLIRPRVS
jgi:hypothetical protein